MTITKLPNSKIPGNLPLKLQAHFPDCTSCIHSDRKLTSQIISLERRFQKYVLHARFFPCAGHFLLFQKREVTGLKRSNHFYFNSSGQERWTGATARVLDVSEQPHACEGNDSSAHGHRGNGIAKIEQGYSDDKNSAHAVGDAVGDGGGSSEKGEGGVVV